MILGEQNGVKTNTNDYARTRHSKNNKATELKTAALLSDIIN